MSRHNVTFWEHQEMKKQIFYEFRKRCNMCQEGSERMLVTQGTLL